MRRTDLLIAALGIFAVLSGVLGYGGLYRKIAPSGNLELKRECYRIIDAAQIWHAKPKYYGGGGRSFENLDFHRIGIAEQPNDTTYHGAQGTFAFENITPFSFDLTAVGKDGSRLEARRVHSDTRPHLKEID